MHAAEVVAIQCAGDVGVAIIRHRFVGGWVGGWVGFIGVAVGPWS